MKRPPPERFIAIRRRDARGGRGRPRAARAAGPAAMAALRADAAAPIAALEFAGLEEAPALEALPPQPDLGGFVHVPHTASMIIEPPVGTSVAAVRDMVGDEYLVMPDVELTLPVTSAATTIAPSKVRKATTVLPKDVGVAQAHRAGDRGAGAVVAVFDTGCDADHDEFADGRVIDFGFVAPGGSEIRERRGFDTATHGTHVCGTIAGRRVGVAPQADLIVASVIESEKISTSASRLWQALGWLVERTGRPAYKDKPVILCMSLGFTPDQVEAADMKSTMLAVRELLRECLMEDDILPIVAIGNEGDGHVRAPGYYPEVLSVGAVDYAQAVWPKSGGGAGPAGFEQERSPDLAGFGVGVVSALDRDAAGQSRYGAKSGTSMAAPYVAGIAALVAAQTGLQGVALRDTLLETALPLGGGAARRAGAGLARCL